MAWPRVATGALAALLLATLLAACEPTPSPATAIGSPVRATTAEGDRTYLLTSQWNTMRPVGTRRSSSTGPVYTHLYVDVWAFDDAARPVWRTRVIDERSGVNQGRTLLGAAGGRLWLLDGAGVIGLDLVSGERSADTAAIETANPSLRGLIPTEEPLYRFDAAGLAFTAADGRAWRVDGRTLAARPAKPPAEAIATASGSAREGVFPKSRIGGGNSTYGFTRMDIRLGDRWLGLLSDEQAETVRRDGDIGYGVIGGPPPRVKMYSGYGARPRVTRLEPLPEAPDFLDGHLLHHGEFNDPPIQLTEPDSVLVLHRDRLGDAGRLQLSRVAGPAGKVLWTAPLPISRLESVMPGDRTLMLLGRRDEPQTNPSRSNVPESVDQLISVDLATGRSAVYGFKVLPTKGPKIPESSTPTTAEQAGDTETPT